MAARRTVARTFQRGWFHDTFRRDRQAATPEGRAHRCGGALQPRGTVRQARRRDDEKPAEDTPIGPRVIIKGLDGMSRVADKGNTVAGGHNAAAVISSALLTRRSLLFQQVF